MTSPHLFPFIFLSTGRFRTLRFTQLVLVVQQKRDEVLDHNADLKAAGNASMEPREKGTLFENNFVHLRSLLKNGKMNLQIQSIRSPRDKNLKQKCKLPLRELKSGTLRQRRRKEKMIFLWPVQDKLKGNT